MPWEAQTQPSLYGYRPNSSIRDLILMGGEERARRAERAGNIWANTIGNIGNTVAGAVQQHQEVKQQQKEQAKMAARDAYVAQTINQWDGQDHKALAAKLVSALGPVEGVKMATNISAFSKSVGEKDPERHLTGTVAGLRLIDGQSDDAVAANWSKAGPILQQTADQMGIGVKLPEQWDPSLRPTLKTIQGTLEQKLGFKAETPAKVGTHVVGGNLVDDAGKVLFAAEQKPEKTPQERAQEEFLVSRARAQGTASVKPPAEAFDVTPNVQTTASGRKFLDLSNYKGNEGNAARKAAEAAGAVGLSKEDASVLQEIDAARSNTSDITSQIEGKLASSPLGRLAKAGENKLSALFQTDDDLAAYGAWRTAAIKNLRATAGSKGLRLNQAEIELAIQNDIPQLTDTVAVAKKKAQILNTMFDNAEKAVFGGRGAAPTPKASAPTVHSQAEVDALPAGTVFIDSTDGKKYKKGS